MCKIYIVYVLHLVSVSYTTCVFLKIPYNKDKIAALKQG